MVCAACTRGTDTTTTGAPTTTVVATTTSTAAPTTITMAPSTTAAAETTVPLLLAPVSEMGPGWTEQVFPYGETEEFLGTSPGGDGVLWGPDYGTQTPDGTWWFLDAARLRIAHFDGDGTYLDQVLVPEDLLVNGVYFQFQMPQALDDGSVAIGGFDRPLLRIVDGEISGLDVENGIPWDTTDGEQLYGMSFEEGMPRRLDPNDPVIEPVEWFGSRDGSRYRVTVIEDEVLVELPDIGVLRTLQMRFSEEPDVAVRAGVEVETGEDGTMFIMFNGAPTSDETLGVGGIVSVGPDGTVGEVEPTVDLFSMSDPGSPAHLGVTPGTSDPWLMVVGEDGVHVFTKDG